MIEAIIIDYLTGKLYNGSALVPVSGDVPEDPPDTFVTVELLSGGVSNKIESASVAVQSWASTRAAAAALNNQVKAVMADAVSLGKISHCRLDTNYNFTDATTKHPRYQAVFEVVFFN